MAAINCIAYFVLSGRFAPEELTRFIGVSPTGVRRQGDFIKGGVTQYDHDEWIVAGNWMKTVHVQDAIYDVFSVMSRHAEAARNAARLFSLDSQLRVILDPPESGGYPRLDFSLEILRRLLELGATLHVSLR